MSTFTNYVEAKNKNLKELSNEEIFFLVIKKHNNDQCDCRKCYINICNIKNRKINQ